MSFCTPPVFAHTNHRFLHTQTMSFCTYKPWVFAHLPLMVCVQMDEPPPRERKRSVPFVPATTEAQLRARRLDSPSKRVAKVQTWFFFLFFIDACHRSLPHHRARRNLQQNLQQQQQQAKLRGRSLYVSPASWFLLTWLCRLKRNLKRNLITHRALQVAATDLTETLMMKTFLSMTYLQRLKFSLVCISQLCALIDCFS